MYYYNQKTGLIVPLWLYAIWKWRWPFASFVGFMVLLGVISAPYSTPIPQATEAQKAAQAARAWKAYQISSCRYVIDPKDVQFCKTLR